ncbi:Smr domain-containing [Lecanosticta acicola]|uniref:Smr domain-containing n=1 Tax=Lecanosticta acicola TaxID=111012 RepID=A0AAI9ECB5_9PEZI|nr:Smr domain-containing [Lecanosticta acicola]
MAEMFTKLEAEYCPPLDPALLSAILSDFDLSSTHDVEQARATLDPLKESAFLEEAAGFDAAGTGAQDESLGHGSKAESCPGTSVSLSRETDLTSLSNGLSSLELDQDLDDGSHTPGTISTAEDIETLDEDTKIQMLLDVTHGRVTRYSAKHTLRKCNGKWHAALDELLNHVFFDEAGQGNEEHKVSAKGIDAFSEENVAKRGRKRKHKVQNARKMDDRRSSSLPISPIDSTVPVTNKWQTAGEDIDFIASRTGMATSSVASIYYSNGTSLSRTISDILKTSVQNDTPSDDPIIAVNAHDLGLEFPTIIPAFAAALVGLTHPSTAAARELAKALTTRPQVKGGVQIVPQYRPPQEEDTEIASQIVGKKSKQSNASNLSSELSDLNGQANAYAAARRTALSQAYAAHRKAKSDRLMAGAAAYYGQVSRDNAALYSRSSAAAADQLAQSQSGAGELDLHGIDVLNAVRIAQGKVEEWWQGLGEQRANGRLGAAERQAGYRIVVGRGTHSEDGKSKLGPAVTKMLKSDGWRFEPAGAVIVVKGRARTGAHT